MKLLLYQALEFLAVGCNSPSPTIERIEIHTFGYILPTDAFQHPWAPKWRLWDRENWLDTCRRGRILLLGAGSLLCSLRRFLDAFFQCFLLDMLYKCLTRFKSAGELVNDIQAFEGIAGVENAGFVSKRCSFGRLIVDKKDTAAKRAINGCSADDNREGETSFMQLLDTQWHLLRSAHQQGRETNSISIDLNSFLQNNVKRYLLTKVVD